MPNRKPLILLLAVLCLLVASAVTAKNPYRSAFLDVYPAADGTQLTDLPSNAGHCGICHFDFDGGGQRNAYGLALEVALGSGLYATTQEAVLSLEGGDADNDGYLNEVEITSTLFTNTPTFPGLSTSNVDGVVNVLQAEVEPYLTPAGSSDTTPPDVLVTAPVGGESWDANTLQAVSWTATDASGVSHIDVYLSDDGGATWKPVAKDLPETGGFDWFVPNRPGALNLLRVEAYDNAGNEGHDDSDASFTIVAPVGGAVPTTLRDFDMPGTQPFQGAVLEDADANCASCHGNYDHAVEPWAVWRGSMMAQSMRDPLFLATLAVAEQDAPSVGDLCLRCHTPGGWQEGRSTDTTGGQLTAKDKQGVQCDFCHRMVDPEYVEGVSPAKDAEVLGNLETVPLDPANGMFINDPDPIRRGPYADAPASHQFLESPFHRESALCGTCHDVSNPVFIYDGTPGSYSPHDLDAPHPDGDLRNMFPVERTYSEWSVSAYANGGVYQPQFAGDKPDGIVSTCQDCHMRDVTGAGAATGPTRTDLPMHDLTGGNHFVPDILADFAPGEVDTAQLNAAKARVEAMLSLAATLDFTGGQQDGQPTVTVRVTNETGHKLPSGYPEGRRMWLNLKAFDGGGAPVYESAAYDFATGELGHDADARIYHIEPGISTRLAAATGAPAGPSFHFVLNDTVYLDNRIPPRGTLIADLEAIQSPPVAHAYADSQHWDDVLYVLPAEAREVEATLYYQSTSKEYIEFLRDENTTNTLGQELYDAWVAQGRAAPVVMAAGTFVLDLTAVDPAGPPARGDMLAQNAPNPFNPRTAIDFAVARAGRVSLRVFDARGRLVRTLIDDDLPAGRRTAVWDGRDDAGRTLPSGVYAYALRTPDSELRRKMLLLK